MSPLLVDEPATWRFWVPTTLLATALVVVVVFISTEPWPGVLAIVLFAAAAPVLAAIDWRERRLPDVITLPLAVGCFAVLAADALLTDQWPRLGIAVLCSLGATAFFLVLFIISPSQMGFGDVKLMLSAGLVLGWYGLTLTILGIALGLVLGLVYGLVQIALKRAHRRTHLALGPHLIAGVLIVGTLAYSTQ